MVCICPVGRMDGMCVCGGGDCAGGAKGANSIYGKQSGATMWMVLLATLLYSVLPTNVFAFGGACMYIYIACAWRHMQWHPEQIVTNIGINAGIACVWTCTQTCAFLCGLLLWLWLFNVNM